MRHADRLKLPKRTVLALILASVVGTALADQTAEVEAATGRWISAFNRKSTADVVALYAPDAVFFGTTSPVLRDSPELIEDYFKGLGHLGDATVVMGEHRVQLLGNTAINTGYYTLTAERDGATVRSPARFTFVYQLRNGAWMIIAHHSSALP